MNKKIVLIVLICILFSSIVFAQVITQDSLDKELENTLRDNELAQKGATTGYSFYTNAETGEVDFVSTKRLCVCEDDN